VDVQNERAFDISDIWYAYRTGNVSLKSIIGVEKFTIGERLSNTMGSPMVKDWSALSKK
jgi:hypothetical protein